MGRPLMMGYGEALAVVLDSVEPVAEEETRRLSGAVGRLLSRDLVSNVDSPSLDASTKDGFAVRSVDVAQASPESPKELVLKGTAAAGGSETHFVGPGDAVRVLTGAGIPAGADAVLAEEFARVSEDRIAAFNTADPGRNILPRGEDVRTGERIAPQGTWLTPGMIGMIAAAGLGEVPVYRRPKVAILATGDELVEPGRPLSPGQLHASNMEMLKAWCLRYGMEPSALILGDRPDLITRKIEELTDTHDALLTSGGAWTGDRDFTVMTLEALGWQKKFHAIRIGPGKPVGFGLLGTKPVFLLPGGPPSNLTAFLMIALPGLMRLAGHNCPGLPRATVTLADGVKGRQADWTQFIYGRLEAEDPHTLFHPLTLTSRLKSMAGAQAVIAIPEGTNRLPKGDVVAARLLI